MFGGKGEMEMKKSFGQTLKQDFNTTALVMIPLCVGINIVGEFICQSLKLPLWLNVEGTIIAAVLAGPWVGASTGILTNVVLSFTIEGPTALPFALISCVWGLVAGFLANLGFWRVWWKAVIAGGIGELIQVPVSAPIIVYMFGGITAGASSAFTAFMMATGHNIWTSVISTGLLVDGADKVLSSLIAFFIIQALPKRMLYRFSRAAHNVLGDKKEEEYPPVVPEKA